MQFDKIGDHVINTLNNTGKNVFITGKAGTGKTTLLRYFLNNTHKKAVVIAPTGIAALNIGGQTIHAFFGFSTTVTLLEAKKAGEETKKAMFFRKLDTIVIDEISMVRADLLDCIDVFLKEVRKNSFPFGGVQMVFVGDLYQLPPVVTYNEREIFSRLYESPYFFSSKIVKSLEMNFEIIELENIYRQSDEKFIDLLNKIRTKTVTADDLDLLNHQVVKNFSDVENGVVYLCGTNEKVAMINQDKLDIIEEKEFDFYAEVDGNFKEKDFPTNEILTLKKGCQVMFTVNDPQGRRVNGTIGEIIDIFDYIVKVKIYSSNEEVIVERYTWEVKKYFYDTAENKISSEIIGSFKQIPVKLAWAITIHKSQGKTFDKVVIDFERGIFAHGQAYVALSRCTSLEGIQLIKPLRTDQIIMDERINNFYNTTK